MAGSARIGPNPAKPAGRPWRRFRAAVLRQLAPGGRCQACGQVRALELHHLLPRAEGGPLIPPDIYCPETGLRALCRRCHQAETRRWHRRPKTAGERAWADLLDRLGG